MAGDVKHARPSAGRTPAGREWQRWLWPGRGYCSTDPALLHPPNLLNPAELQWPLYHKEIGTEAFTRLSPRAPPAGPRSIVWRASTACVGQCGFRRPSQAAWRWPLHSVFTWQTPSINAFVCCALKWRCKGEAKRGQTGTMLHAGSSSVSEAGPGGARGAGQGIQM